MVKDHGGQDMCVRWTGSSYTRCDVPAVNTACILMWASLCYTCPECRTKVQISWNRDIMGWTLISRLYCSNFPLVNVWYVLAFCPGHRNDTICVIRDIVVTVGRTLGELWLADYMAGISNLLLFGTYFTFLETLVIQVLQYCNPCEHHSQMGPDNWGCTTTYVVASHILCQLFTF